MDADLKKILKAVVLEMRHELEGYYDNAGKWHPGDLETRLAEIGVRKDRASVPVDELGRLIDEDIRARKIVDAFIDVREQAGVDRAEAVAEYIRGSAYTWANRLVALRCMEARELLDDEVIVGREAYGGRSLVHHRLAQSSPELCTGEDDGRFAMLAQVFAERAKTLPMLFDPDSPSISLRPSPAALKNCLAWLSGTQKVRSQEPATDAVFAAPDALGWAYQYWNTEEKDRVFETVRTKKGTKIEGADIIPATQLYTEDYMVKFLVQNSLGATWMGMHPDSKLFEGWEYYVRDTDRASAKKKPLQQITLLDPACGSGHFLIEAFDMFYAMYEEEGSLKSPEAICRSILENNLFGIDIDERAIQIAEASLWMKAEEKAFGFGGANTNLVSATSSHLKGESWERFLTGFEKEPHIPRILREFAKSIAHIDELGSLARPFEALQEIINAEHEIWERQERERHASGNFLFQELRDEVLATQLPFQDISDKEFFQRTLRHSVYAIDGFTKEARESGDFNDQLIGAEAKTGFRLLNLLGQTYDIVVANPPYMGSKNMGPVLKSHINTDYPSGKRDIYAAFILRALGLASSCGRVAMITQQSWMFLNCFAGLRYSDSPAFGGILKESVIETLAHLGTNSFAEISGHVVNSVMFTLRREIPDQNHRIISYRLIALPTPNAKSKCLREAIVGRNLAVLSRPYQNWILEIPNAPICYWLPKRFFDLLAGRKLRDIALVKKGLATLDNDRFIRMFWEVDRSNYNRWRRLAKAGANLRWNGGKNRLVEWAEDGKRVKLYVSAVYKGAHWSKEVRSPELYFRKGLCYSIMSQGSLCVRQLDDEIFENKTGAIFNADSLHPLLNTRLASFFMRILSSGLEFNTGTLELMPLPVKNAEWQSAVELKDQIVRLDPTEMTFSSKAFWQEAISAGDEPSKRWLLDAVICAIEAYNELESRKAFELTEEEIRSVDDEVGLPAGLLPLVDGKSSILDGAKGFREFAIASSALEKLPTCKLSTEEETSLRLTIKALLSNHISSNDNIESTHDDDFVEEEVLSSGLPIPPQSRIEEISEIVGFHPFAVLEFINEGFLQEGWSDIEGKRHQILNSVSITILTLLGYHWPIDVQESDLYLRDECEAIVPVVGVAKESMLETQVSVELQKIGIDLLNVSASLGKSLGDWLASDFFDFHIKHFKKRPIAWHLRSCPRSARQSPIFSCLIYSLRVDSDTLAKICTHYTNPIRARFETELRGIAATSTTERSDRQAKRAVELEELIAELHAFDAALQAVSSAGFGPESTRPVLRQYAFEDAILSMKACWLQRLSVLLTQPPGDAAGNGVRTPSPLDDWRDQAIKTELHQDLAAWIGEALSHLSYHCSQVGPSAPDAKRIHEDPSNADFGSLIQAEIGLMQTGSMKLACGVWWGKFDAAVLAPIRERIKVLKAEQKELNAAIKEDRQPVLVVEQVLEESAENGSSKVESAVADMPLLRNHVFEQTIELTKAAMKSRLKEVKAKIKKFTEDMDSKAGKAHAIRDAIQAWQLPNPIPASLDFSPSSPNLPPLFDQFSSLDERRAPPKTIADFIAQESLYAPDINDGVRVNIAPLQKAGILAADVLAAKDVDKAIADRAEWRADERRWVREGRLSQPGWWSQPNQVVDEVEVSVGTMLQPELTAPGRIRPDRMDDALYGLTVLKEMLLLRPDGIEPIQLAEAFCLLADKDRLFDLLKTYVSAVEDTAASHWHVSFDQTPNTQFLLEYFKELHSREFAEYSSGKFIPGVAATPKNGWARYDASLALAAVEAMPRSLRDEIVQSDVKEMVISLRLVG